ncbi:3-hydroxyacyl-CoA dehydrogenase [Zobellella endophytica]|uniref:3-hydroxyacyl-CoA dehydrogenase n=1 Tax=Zobellella endophytica TaxID=2116700 RepID=A0A2P7R628_9GAMM|nr:3-hydroxyacyl-CoA dehydrogenase [Zobellella endophytica]PSJ45670.1 3-hydroxyacyl-CoA dehydrogenase [Zobellella endophytica]
MSRNAIQRVAVIGAGTMGLGIAQVAAQAGHSVQLYDVDPARTRAALAELAERLALRVARGRLAEDDRTALLARLVPAECLAELAEAELVIEAVVERLEVKQQLFRELEAICGEQTMFASNTSSISITAIGAALARPERLAGLHFFNPAPVMKLVEVISGLATAAPVRDTLLALARDWGKVAVHARSTPGFIVNRIARPYYGETLRALQEGVAEPGVLDALMRSAGGFPMGACELTDLIGQDVNFAVSTSVYRAFFDEPRYRPSLVQQALVDAGRLGRKSGQGFYRYQGGQPEVQELPSPAGRAPERVVVRGDWSGLKGVEALLARYPGTIEREGGAPALLIDGVCVEPTNGQSAALRHPGRAAMALDWAEDYERAQYLALGVSACCTPEQVAAVTGFFQALGKQVLLLSDHPGLLVLRTLATLVNEAAEACLHGVASPEDIDLAMRYGVNYPKGPVAWGAEIGYRRLLALLERLHALYGEDKYRPSLTLRHWAAREEAHD